MTKVGRRERKRERGGEREAKVIEAREGDHEEG